MEINILEKSKNKLSFEIVGEDHTFCNILRKELWNDSSLKSAGYSMETGLQNIPKFTLETAGKTPQKALTDAVSRLIKKGNDFLNKLKK